MVETVSAIDHPSRWSAGQSIHRQLHDVVVPQMFLLSTGLTALQRRDLSAADETLVRDLAEVATNALSDLRRISRGDVLSAGGDMVRVGGRLRVQTSSATRLTGCQVDLVVEGAATVPAALEDDLVAVAWEGMTNAIRHGRATAVDVALVALNGWIHLCVEDNGSWTSTGDVDSSGIDGLRARAQGWGGEVTVETGDESTRLEFRVPIPGATRSSVAR